MHLAAATHPDPTSVSCRAIGALLGRHHDVPNIGIQAREHWLSTSATHRRVEQLATLPQLAGHPVFPAVENLGQAVLENLPHAVMRGDIHEFNFLMHNGAITAISGWEAATIGAGALHIASAVRRMCLSHGDVVPARLTALLDGYAANRALPFADLAALSRLVPYVGLTVSVWPLHRYHVENADPRLLDLSQPYWREDLDKIDLDAGM